MIRHKIYQILIIIFALTLSACEENFVEANKVVIPIELGEVITNVATDITENSVKLSGEIVSKGNSDSVEVGFLLYTGNVINFEINTSGVEKYVASVSGNSFSKSITSLTSSTKYKFRTYIKNEAGISYGQVKNFTTETGITQGEVTTKDAIEIKSSEARLRGDLVSTGNSTNYTIGFILYQGNLTNFTLTTSGVQNFEVPNSKSIFVKTVTNLNDSTTYKFRAYITNEEGTSYGEVKTFTTVSVTQGQVTTNDATNIEFTTATLKGTLNSRGNSSNYTVGFLLYQGSASNFTLNTSGVQNYTTTESGTSLISKELTDLNDNTTYKFRAYITNEAGTTYGDIKTFTTKHDLSIQTLTGHTSSVESVSYSPDGTKIISSSWDNRIKIWDANTGACLRTLTGHSNSVNSVAYSPDGTKIISGSDDNTIKIWNANTGQCLQTLTENSDDVESVSYSPDGTKIVSTTSYYSDLRHGIIKIWDANTGACIQTLEAHTSYVNSVSYSPDGTKIISGSSVLDGTIKIWDANTGACIQTLSGHTSSVESVSYSPDGTKIISSSWDNRIKIWDANTGACIQTLTGHTSYVNSVSYSPDGTKIISGSSDKTIKIWDANTGQCLQTLTGHSRGVNSVAYSPDGTKIISGSSDNTIKIWGEN